MAISSLCATLCFLPRGIKIAALTLGGPLVRANHGPSGMKTNHCLSDANHVKQDALILSQLSNKIH